MRIRFHSRGVRRLAERALTGPVSPRAHRRLARALDGSESDRKAYHQLARLMGQLEGRQEEDALTTAQRERILAAVTPRSAEGRPAHAIGWPLRYLAPVAALLLVTLLLLPRPEGPELQSRGSARLAAEGHLGLEVTCFRDGKPVAPPDRTSRLDARCRLDDELQLTLTHTAGFEQLLVLGLQEGARQEGARRTWYFPVPPDGRSGAVPRDVAQEPLGQAIRLAVNHRPGPLRLFAVFSHSTLQADQLLAWLETIPDDQTVNGLTRGDVTLLELRVMIEGDAP